MILVSGALEVGSRARGREEEEEEEDEKMGCQL
jgi:hypothetical protein